MSSGKFKELMEQCSSLFYYGCDVDRWLLEMILLPYVTLSWKQLPVWIRIIAPPSSGKSVHLSLVQDLDITYVVDEFTSKSFVSGFRGNNEDPSQLPMMHKKVLLISDESTIMEQRKEERNMIQSILRRAYDGSVTKAFGNLKEKVQHKSEFNILIASTPIIDRYYLYNQALGERFMNYRLQVPNRRLIAEKAIYNQEHGFKRKKKQLSTKIRIYLESIIDKKFRSIKLTEDTKRVLIDCASFVSLLRTHVTRDMSGRFITVLPQPEVASRLVQQMSQVVIGNAIIVGDKKVTQDQLDKAVYVALCSAPSVTVYVLYIVWLTSKKRKRRWHSTKDLMLATHLGQLSVKNIIEDLCVHRILRMKKSRSQSGRILEYSLSRYTLEAIESTELFKNYDHGMGTKRGRSKERRQ